MIPIQVGEQNLLMKENKVLNVWDTKIQSKIVSFFCWTIFSGSTIIESLDKVILICLITTSLNSLNEFSLLIKLEHKIKVTLTSELNEDKKILISKNNKNLLIKKKNYKIFKV